MTGEMYDLTGWEQITCEESNSLRCNERIWSSLTDPDGNYGESIIFTEWGTTSPTLRDYRWPGSERKCEHYASNGRNGK